MIPCALGLQYVDENGTLRGYTTVSVSGMTDAGWVMTPYQASLPIYLVWGDIGVFSTQQINGQDVLAIGIGPDPSLYMSAAPAPDTTVADAAPAADAATVDTTPPPADPAA